MEMVSFKDSGTVIEPRVFDGGTEVLITMM